MFTVRETERGGFPYLPVRSGFWWCGKAGGWLSCSVRLALHGGRAWHGLSKPIRVGLTVTMAVGVSEAL